LFGVVVTSLFTETKLIEFSGMTREQVSRFVENCASALGHCLLEDAEVLIPVILILAGGAFLWIIGVTFYEIIFDPHATNVAAALDSLSIDPDKWLPRV